MRARSFILWLLYLVTLTCPLNVLAQSGSPLDFDLLAPVRAQRNEDWRDAWRMPPGIHTVSLPLRPGTAQVHLGLLSPESAGTTVSATIHAAGRLLETWTLIGGAPWIDRGLPCKDATEIVLSYTSEEEWWCASWSSVPPKDATQPNILIYMIDTLRADRLGCYGYARNTSPRIDAFAEETWLFEDVMAQASWTRPSIATLLTSTYPPAHGGEDYMEPLRGGLTWIGEALQEAGYTTAAFMSNPNCIPRWGFGPGFDRFVDVGSKRWTESDDARAVDKALSALRYTSSPWCYYVHVMGPHAPYERPAGYSERFLEPVYQNEWQKRSDMYDGAISYSDYQFGRMLDALEERGELENTLILLLSDHGEEFMEHHQEGHGKALFQESIHVPLLIRLPGQTHGGKRVKDLVELIDLAPTLLDLLHLDPKSQFEGTSFAPVFEGQPLPGDTIASSFLKTNRRQAKAARQGQLKYMDLAQGKRQEWYDLAEDPLEQHPLEIPPEAERIQQHLTQLLLGAEPGLHLYLQLSGPRAVPKLRGFVEGVTLKQVTRTDRFQTREAPEGLFFRIAPPSSILPGLGPIPFPFPRIPAPGNLLMPFQVSQEDPHLVLDIGNVSEISIRLFLDDNSPIPNERILLRGKPLEGALHDAPLSMSKLVIDAGGWTLPKLAALFAVHLWYLPNVEVLDEEALDPELRDVLRDMGYLE